MSTEPLGRAEVEIRANTSKLGGDLSAGEAAAKKGAEKLGKTTAASVGAAVGVGASGAVEAAAENTGKTFGQRFRRSLSQVMGPAIAAVGAVAVIQRLEAAYRSFVNAGSELSEQQRSIGEAFSGGSLSSGLSEYEREMERLNKTYEQQKRLLDALAESRDLATKAAEAAYGDPTQLVLLNALSQADREARKAAAAREANALDYQASTIGMNDLEKLEYQKKRKLEEFQKYKDQLTAADQQRALDNINKIHDYQIRMLRDQANYAVRSVKESAQAAANNAFGQNDVQVTWNKIAAAMMKTARQEGLYGGP